MRFLYIAIFLLVASCVSPVNGSRIPDEENICKYSKWLRISETEELVTIEIINPDDPEQIRRITLPNFEGSKKKSKHYDIEDPLNRLVCLSNTHIGMMCALGQQQRIVAVSDVKYIYDSALKSRKVSSMGDEQAISPERIIKSKAQSVIYSAFSHYFPKQEVLEKLGIHVIPNYDWRETNVLGKAEWILLFGYLTGNSKKAKMVFNDICKNYNACNKSSKPSASPVIISGNMNSDVWYAPAGQSYHAQLFSDAGMSYVFADKKGTGSAKLTLESALLSGQNASIWLNPGFSSKSSILKANSKLSYLNPMKKGKVYCYSHDSNKYWELSACRPDLVLADYVKISSGDTSDLFFYKLVE